MPLHLSSQQRLCSCTSDTAPSHRAKATRDLLRNVVSDFISAEEWAPHSLDLNPLDYSVWDFLREPVNER